MRLYSGNRMVEIEMQVWDGEQYTPDWSRDFFDDLGQDEYNEELDAFEVEDIDYCIEQAEDWKHSRGDFADDEPNEGNTVTVEELDLPPMTKDGHYISVGDWLQDETGIYMVWSRGKNTELKEVLFDDDNSDNFHMGETRILTDAEIGKMTVC